MAVDSHRRLHAAVLLVWLEVRAGKCRRSLCDRCYFVADDDGTLEERATTLVLRCYWSGPGSPYDGFNPDNGIDDVTDQERIEITHLQVAIDLLVNTLKAVHLGVPKESVFREPIDDAIHKLKVLRVWK